MFLRCPSFVLACSAAGCVTDFAANASAYVPCPRKILHCATWHCMLVRIAPACGARNFIRLRVTSLWRRAFSDIIKNYTTGSHWHEKSIGNVVAPLGSIPQLPNSIVSFFITQHPYVPHWRFSSILALLVASTSSLLGFERKLLGAYMKWCNFQFPFFFLKNTLIKCPL